MNATPRFCLLVNNEEVSYQPPAVWMRQALSQGGQRLVATFAEDQISRLAHLAARMEAPFIVLYVLHTPRGEASPGRYQSPDLDDAELRAFLSRFESYFLSDARFDLWIHSVTSQSTLVWDRHDKLFAYGLLDAFENALQDRGYHPEKEEAFTPVPHVHYYRQENDALARDLIARFDWRVTALHPEDEQ
jgi:hypothetical protein